jgi:hypothetical protein
LCHIEIDELGLAIVRRKIEGDEKESWEWMSLLVRRELSNYD